MFVTKMIAEKRRYKQYKARVKQLPANYLTAIEALERYFMHFGPGEGDNLVSMLEDLADLFEHSVADQTPIRDVVGDDPVEFADEFLRNYPEGQWIQREQRRLVTAIDSAVDDGTTPEGQDR
ncbi:DUF1048 domain-containing protein [Gordonia sp. ABSL11-1]|uniref:DUF1048 domain-containing protein n=1 Tax=Gordonia sp. ABSL11-1 TaxID=3053924 RepID=UPI0025744C71|nr:DUF1048 domain-containing protein [Gordonia sp. ABSL11-1]MDL9945360.1 DUF1048 domain-containing protein [Gordonia sp. ABSL11-1]